MPLIVRAYRVGKRINISEAASLNRDIVVEFADYWTRRKNLMEASQQNGLDFQGSKISVFLDLPSKMLKIHRDLKPTISKLQAAVVKYRWLRSGKMFVEYNQAQYIAYDRASGVGLLSALGLSTLEQGGTTAEKRKIQSPLTSAKSNKLYITEEAEDGEIELGGV